jgi:hypothetical protein
MFPFEIWYASNDFNDEFHVLHATLRLEPYEIARRQRAGREDRAAYRQIAEVFTELGTYIRFIAVSLDASKALTSDPGLKESQIKKLVFKYIGVQAGYLGDFSYQTHADFYTDLDLEIDPYKYQGTTRERFTQILTESSPSVQAAILDGILTKYPIDSNKKRSRPLADEIAGWARALRSGSAVAHPTPLSAPDVVKRALSDSEQLLNKNGAASAVDRVHTALHGYQLGLCNECGISVPEDASLTLVFKLLRKSHPAFQISGHRAQDVDKVLNALSSILDALNPIRNRASVAHPNPVLLDETDARLVINSSRTIFHYLEAKVVAERNERERVAAASPPDDDAPF